MDGLPVDWTPALIAGIEAVSPVLAEYRTVAVATVLAMALIIATLGVLPVKSTTH